jgi:hypothetical protein
VDPRFHCVGKASGSKADRHDQLKLARTTVLVVLLI